MASRKSTLRAEIESCRVNLADLYEQLEEETAPVVEPPRGDEYPYRNPGEICHECGDCRREGKCVSWDECWDCVGFRDIVAKSAKREKPASDFKPIRRATR